VVFNSGESIYLSQDDPVNAREFMISGYYVDM
jgi:hypothetical protein